MSQVKDECKSNPKVRSRMGHPCRFFKKLFVKQMNPDRPGEVFGMWVWEDVWCDRNAYFPNPDAMAKAIEKGDIPAQDYLINRPVDETEWAMAELTGDVPIVIVEHPDEDNKLW